MKRILGSDTFIKNIWQTLLHMPLLVHVRHYRGHGVHSPFVYDLIRNVLMQRNLTRSGLLYDVLRGHRVPKRRAVQIQHLYKYCNYVGFHIVEHEKQFPIDGHTLYIALPDVEVKKLLPLAQQLEGNASALCILSPRSSRNRLRGCEILVRHHRSTSLDNRGFQLLFFDARLPKQHYKL